NPAILAITATATPEIRNDVARHLGMRDPFINVTGFARPNLRFDVARTATPAMKNDRMLEIIRQANGAGVVYTATVREAEAVHDLLNQAFEEEGFEFGLYH